MLTQCGTLSVILGLIYISAGSEVPDAAPKSVNMAKASQVLLGNTLYFIENKVPIHWFGARKICEGMGYNLISLETTEKIKAINTYLDSKKTPTPTGLLETIYLLHVTFGSQVGSQLLQTFGIPESLTTKMG
ncbi:hypothetical protein KR038_006739 [Drosophila bunnanda]|nr:hypothetical protein KR038_006739 [Drosophila bunnanda]